MPDETQNKGILCGITDNVHQIKDRHAYLVVLSGVHEGKTQPYTSKPIKPKPLNPKP